MCPHFKPSIIRFGDCLLQMTTENVGLRMQEPNKLICWFFDILSYQKLWYVWVAWNVREINRTNRLQSNSNSNRFDNLKYNSNNNRWQCNSNRLPIIDPIANSIECPRFMFIV